jgi:eukaryotic-like serine/threonine-protein kinase
MGIIFRATQLTVGRKVAVKVLRPSLAKNTDLITRFSHEVEVIAGLAHPNIVALIDSGLDATGLTYLAMEYVEGETFRVHLRRAKLSLRQILDVFSQVCDALSEAHDLGVIHRDLKFENIMLRRVNQRRLHAIVLDFGIAKQLSSSSSITRTGEVPGTPGIIAPELIDGIAPSPQSDLYSLGVLLFTALTATIPFEGRNDLDMMRAHKFDEVPSLVGRITNEIPAELVQMVYDLLEKEPQNRPRHAASVGELLASIASGLTNTDPYFPPALLEHSECGEAGGASSHAEVHGTPAQSGIVPVRISKELLSNPLPRPESKDTQSSMVSPSSIVTALTVVLILLALLIVHLLTKIF